MKFKKHLLLATSLVITFLLSACASAPSHLILSPEIIAQGSKLPSNKQASLNVVDMRTANHIIQILREGEAATLISAHDRLEDTINKSLSEHWQKQGLSIESNAVNSILITVEKAQINVEQKTLNYQADSEIVLKVAVNNSLQILTSTFTNRGNSNGPFKADIAVLERNFNQRLANLLTQILVNEKINQFLK